jgi:hypothetical protein
MWRQPERVAVTIFPEIPEVPAGIRKLFVEDRSTQGFIDVLVELIKLYMIGVV